MLTFVTKTNNFMSTVLTGEKYFSDLPYCTLTYVT